MEVTNQTIVITDPCYLMPDCPIITDYNFDYQKDANLLTPDEQKEYERYSNDLEAYHQRIKERDDWQICNYGMEMNKIGFHNCITSPTYIGDWCWLVNDNITGQVLGQFSADSGMVGVFLMEEIINYDKTLLDKLKRLQQCACIIENYTGTITIEKPTKKNSSARVRGVGNINFKSSEI